MRKVAPGAARRPPPRQAPPTSAEPHRRQGGRRPAQLPSRRVEEGPPPPAPRGLCPAAHAGGGRGGEESGGGKGQELGFRPRVARGDRGARRRTPAAAGGRGGEWRWEGARARVPPQGRAGRTRSRASAVRSPPAILLTRAFSSGLWNRHLCNNFASTPIRAAYSRGHHAQRPHRWLISGSGFCLLLPQSLWISARSSTSARFWLLLPQTLQITWDFFRVSWDFLPSQSG